MNQNINNVTSPTNTSNKNEFILYGLMILVIVGCFLPYVTISASAYGYTYSESINYIYAADTVKDGVYVIICLIAAFTSLKKKKFKGTLIGLGIALGVFIYDFIDVQNLISDYDYYGMVDISYGIGFYLVAIGLVGSLIMAFIIKKNAPIEVATNTSVTVNQMVQPQYQQPYMNNAQQPYAGNVQSMQQTQYVQQPYMGNVQPAQNTYINTNQQMATCQYCGNVRNEGMYCKSCGGKY